MNFEIPPKPVPSEAARRLLTLQAFVQSHGLQAVARDGAVFVHVPGRPGWQRAGSHDEARATFGLEHGRTP